MGHTVVAITPTPPVFRWSAVADQDRDWLRRRTEDIETYAYATACNTVRLGIALGEIRDRLPGHFDAWLRAQTPFSRAHAYRLIATGCIFGAFVSQIEKVSPSALYALAQHTTPVAAREQAVEMASRGERVTRSMALELIDAYRPVRVSGAEVRSYERLRKKLNVFRATDTPGDPELVNQDKLTQQLEQQASERWQRIGRIIEELTAEISMLRVDLLDGPEEVPLYSVTCHWPDRDPRNAVDRDLKRALLKVAGQVETKPCIECCKSGEELSIECFGFYQRSPDGLMPYCKACEQKRKAQFRIRQRKGQVKRRVKREVA